MLLDGCGFIVANLLEGPGDIGANLNSAKPVLAGGRVCFYLRSRCDFLRVNGTRSLILGFGTAVPPTGLAMRGLVCLWRLGFGGDWVSYDNTFPSLLLATRDFLSNPGDIVVVVSVLHKSAPLRL